MSDFAELTPQAQQAVQEQVQRFVAALLAEDPAGAGWRARVEQAAALGRAEMAGAARQMQQRTEGPGGPGAADAAAHAALACLRAELAALDPQREGDLLRPRRLLGIIPLGNRLDAYLQRCARAVPRLQALAAQLYAARDDLQRAALELEGAQARLAQAMRALAAAALFARRLDADLQARLPALQAADAARERKLREDVLFAVRRNLLDLQTQQAVCINGRLALDLLERNGRELAAACSRAAEAGLSALAVAQWVARASGLRGRAMDTLARLGPVPLDPAAPSAVGSMAAPAGDAGDAAQGVEALKLRFRQAFETLEAADRLRPQEVPHGMPLRRPE